MKDSELFLLSRHAQVILDPEGKEGFELNAAFLDLFGARSPSQSCLELISGLTRHQGDLDHEVAAVKLLIESEQCLEIELRSRDGVYRTYLASSQKIHCEMRDYLHIMLVEINSIARREALLQSALQGTAAQIGDNYFRSALKTLSKAFGMEVAFVAKLVEEEDEAEMVCFLVCDNFLPPIRYSIEETPCWSIYNEAKTSCIEEGVQKLFPNDEDLQTLNAESYVGVPILDENRKPIGHIALLHSGPKSRLLDHEEMILKIFGARAQTEFRRAEIEKQLLSAKAEAEAANRCKTKFLANISHELRTPMTAIMGFAQILELEEVLGEAQLQMLQSITRNGDALTSLINDVLEMSRIELGRIEINRSETLMTDIIQDLASTYLPIAHAKSIILDFVTSQDVPASLLVDRQKLRQILGNLVGNALIYSPPSGRVQLNVTLQKIPEQKIEFRVSDNGPGIEEELIERIFEPFERGTTQKVAGAGLGLSISKALAEAMLGTIQVSSKPGAGSAFVLSLPVAEVEPPESKVIEPSGLDVSAGQVVLVVDDNVDCREVVRRVLERFKYIVHEAEGGIAGIEFCRKQRPDLILMDIRMPDISGVEAAQTIRKELGVDCPPILGLSGDLLDQNGELKFSNGLECVLAKPFKIQEFIATVQSFLNSRKL
ncbi:MAG: ATP-binding protein [Planctomycetota bacterium]